MLPMQMTVRGIPSSPALESHVRAKCEKLPHYCKRINSCRIVIEVTHKGKIQGKLYNVRIDVTVPGKELVVTRKFDYDVYVAIRDAFVAISRQLEEHGRKKNGLIKTHTHVDHGSVKRLVPTEGYGFIQGNDGNEYYFSITNVSYPSFEKLAIGDHVEYIAQVQQDGLIAHHVIKERSNNVNKEAA